MELILAFIQGITEFLPISSSGHLVIFPWLFGWQDPGLAFNVALHFGTLLAVLIYFRRDIALIIKSAFGNKKEIVNENKYPPGIFWILVIATIPGALAGFFLEEMAETIFRFPPLVAGTLIVLGALLYAGDHYSTKIKTKGKITWKKGIIVGIAQALAIIPGVSRSGATITAGLFLGLDRVSSARFSFLLSAPIIFGASILKAKDFFAFGVGAKEILAILFSALSGYLAIAGMIKFIEKVSYKVFFWHRLALGILILVVYYQIR